jgi:phosphohistidine phosphatase SixA
MYLRTLLLTGLLSLPGIAAFAQAVSPAVDPVKELKGSALLLELRKGGYVLYMRHAANGPPNTQCKNESGLTALGEEQARTVGIALQQLHIGVDHVWASELCRAQQTAALMDTGAVEVTADLNPGGGDTTAGQERLRNRRLLTLPRSGYNTVLVSHVQSGVKSQDDLQTAHAGILVFRAGPYDKPQAVAYIPWQAWEGLLTLAAEAKPSP